MKNLDKPVKIISLIFQIIFLIGSVAMLAAVIASFAAADSFGNFLLKQTGNGQIATNGFEITLADGNGNVIPAAVRIFSFAGLFSMLCMTMIFRNIYLILKTSEGKTWFSKGATPFQKDNTRMVRETGIFSIMIPVIELILSSLAKLIIGVDNVETSVQITGIAMGLAMLCFSQIFAYGQKLEEDTEGLI